MNSDKTSAEKSDNILNAKIDRRRALSTAGKAAIGAVAVIVIGGVAYTVTGTPAAQTVTKTAPAQTVTKTAQHTETVEKKPVAGTVHFVNNTFAGDLVESFIDNFHERNPHITVDWTSLPGGTPIVEKLSATFFASPEDLDVVLVNFGFIPAWADAGWISDIEDLPGVDKLKANMKQSFLDFYSYKGKLYGLPYFGAEFLYAINRDFFDRAGLTDPPTTFDEYVQQLNVFKDKGIVKRPAVHGLGAGLYGIVREWEEISINMGGTGYTLFDPDTLEPNFLDKGDAGHRALQFLVDLQQKHQLLDPTSFEKNHGNIAKDAMAGLTPFAIRIDPHKMINMNNPALTDLAGNFEIFRCMDTGATVLRAEPYALTKHAHDKKAENLPNIQTFLKYIGGREVQRGYAMSKGLGFGYKDLSDDPGIKAAWNRWLDLEVYTDQAKDAVGMNRANPILNLPFFGEWNELAVTHLQNAVLGNTDVASALDKIAADAAKLA